MAFLARSLNSKRVRTSTQSSLDATALVPNSGLAFIDNSTGASAAVSELSRILDDAIEQLDFHGMSPLCVDAGGGSVLQCSAQDRAFLDFLQTNIEHIRLRHLSAGSCFIVGIELWCNAPSLTRDDVSAFSGITPWDFLAPCPSLPAIGQI